MNLNLIDTLNSIKYLKLFYSFNYILLCVLCSLVHYVKYNSNYTQIVHDLTKLDVNSLRSIVELRGLRHLNTNISSSSTKNSSKSTHNQQNAMPKNSATRNNRLLQDIIKNTGEVFGAELENSNRINKHTAPKTFNSAGELLESVEDSRGSVWLIHVIMSDDAFARETGKNSRKTTQHQPQQRKDDCDATRFLKKATYSNLSVNLSKFGILMGTFNCQRDNYFCSLKGWHRPQLVLALIKYDFYHSPKEYVEFYSYDKCKSNTYDSVFEWVESVLKTRLIRNATHDLNIADTANQTNLKLFYFQNNTQMPLYYSTVSYKYHRRAEFYVINESDFGRKHELNSCLVYGSQKTPIFVLIEDKYCYNYGTNLNELPNYVNLNLFLLFLYPDMNCMLLISFFFLNSYLILIFFEYNRSLLRQLLNGLIYLLSVNFILFFVWLLAINTSSRELYKFTSYFGAYLDKFLVWLRYIMMYNELTRCTLAMLRFVAFYYVYLNPCLLFVNHMVLSCLFYAQTRYKYLSVNGNNLLPLKLLVKKNNQTSGEHQSRSMSNRPLMIEASASSSPTRSDAPTSDIDISISELINQINGLTTIWLQSSTYADRLMSEMPSIEYCKCLARKWSREGGDESAVTATSEEDDLHEQTVSTARVQKCTCGRNDELKYYLDKHGLNNFWKKFNNECSICLDKYSSSHGCLITLLPCGHFFHRKCIYEWFMNSVNYKCPVCRTSFYKFKKSL